MSVPSGDAGGWSARVRAVTERLVRALIARPWAALGAALLLTALAGWYGGGIAIRSDMEDLFPDDSPNVVRARAARRALGSRSKLQLYIGSPDRALNRQVAGEIAEGLTALGSPLIGSVEWRRDTAFFEANALLYLPLEDVRELKGRVDDAIADAVRAHEEEEDGEDWGLDDDEDGAAGDATAKPAGKDGEDAEAGKRRIPTEDEIRDRYRAHDLTEYFESPDGQVIAVRVYPTFKPADTAKTRALNGVIEQVVGAVLGRHPGAGLTTATEGDYAHVTAAVDQLRHELWTALLIALGGIGALLIVYFRRLRAVVMTLIPLLAGLAWTFFFARVAVGYLNLITAFIFSILVGLGIDFVVHAASRVDEAFDGGLALEEALPVGLGTLGRAMLAAALTTSATFLALAVFDFRGFSQFGLIAGVGVLLALATVYVVLPPLEILFARLLGRRRRVRAGERADAQRAGGSPHAEAENALAVGGRGRRRALWGLAALLLTAGVSSAFIPRLSFEADMRKMRTKSARKSSALRQKYRREADQRPTSPALYMTGGLDETRALHDALVARKSTEPLINDVRSIFSFVPSDQAAKAALAAEMRRKIRNKRAILTGQDAADADRLLRYLSPKPFGPRELPAWVREHFTDTHGRLGRYVLLYVNGVKSDARHVVEIQRKLGAVRVGDKTYYGTASWMILGDAFTVVQQEGPWAVGLAGLVVLLLVSLDLRRARDVAAIFLPLTAGFVTFLGILGAANIHLNIFNIIVLPTIFGIGVDTSIHLVHRLREGAGVGLALRSTGGAAAVSSATTAVGFGALLFVSNEGLRSIGWVAAIGIVVSYLASVGFIGVLGALGWFQGREAGTPGV